jgi:Flp pilus assembly protein TadG
MRIRKRARNDSGQALVETAFILPLLLIIVLNAVNFAYFFLMALNITSSSRSGAIYSIMGGATPAAMALPTASQVGTMSSQDLTGSVYSPSTNTGVQVCSSRVGIHNPGTTTMGTNCGNGFGSVGTFASTTAEADPELNASNTAPAFLLNRVTVAYQFSPPIPVIPLFNILVLAGPCTGSPVTCTFYRQAVMREMQ